ncbi:MAG: nucleotide-binding protein [Actinomycetota bacterium]|nr:nucleotide-binding protein [Actinomycetota bacterium]
MLQGTTGDWLEYQPDEVIAAIKSWAENPDLDEIESRSNYARERFASQQGNYVSAMSAVLSRQDDEFLRRLMEEGEKVKAFTRQEAEVALLPTGEFMTRDSLAATQGRRVAPHQQIVAQVVALRSPFTACEELAKLADRAAAHIERLSLNIPARTRPQGNSVFIGHGGSPLWREFKDFIQDRLRLPWEEFNRVPVAGTTNVARLSQMLDESGIAFLVLTAEDEQADGSTQARQNVVHEAGLFQGRLGFAKAIILLEEGCEEFSNIEGLGQIRFPRGNISAAFEEARRVLEREGFLDLDQL